MPLDSAGPDAPQKVAAGREGTQPAACPKGMGARNDERWLLEVRYDLLTEKPDRLHHLLVRDAREAVQQGVFGVEVQVSEHQAR